jgi:4-diphosphocytidyl-2C-methyl-D-erythritol kinase
VFDVILAGKPKLQYLVINPNVQLATAQLFEAIAAQDVLHSKPEQRAALTQLLQVSLLHEMLWNFEALNKTVMSQALRLGHFCILNHRLLSS